MDAYKGEKRSIWRFFRSEKPEEFPTAAEADAPKVKGKKEESNRDKEIRWMKEDKQLIEENREKILRLMKDYLEWVFTTAMPLYGYKVVESNDLSILVHPSGAFGWSLGATENVYERLAKGRINYAYSGDNFSLNNIYRPVAGGWESVKWEGRDPPPVKLGEFTFGGYNAATLLGSNPPKVGEKVIQWTQFKEGIQQIIKPVIDELNSRGEWDGTPVEEWYE